MEERIKLDKRTLRATTHHESGHAVVAQALGVPWAWVRLGYEAEYRCTGRAQIPKIGEPRIDSMVDLAGEIAEAWAKLMPADLDDAMGLSKQTAALAANLQRQGGGGEVADARAAAPDGETFLQWAGEVGALLWDNWSAVRAMARRLQREGFVYNQDIPGFDLLPEEFKARARAAAQKTKG